MKKTLLAALRMMVIGIFMIPFISCEKEFDEEQGNDPSKNTTDIAVTGSVEKHGFSYAVINGYVNLNLLPPGNDNPSFGIEMKEEGSSDQKKEYSTALSGKKFTVSCRELSPVQEYSYRTFVIYGGITYYSEYKKFKTKDFENITSTVNAKDITSNSAIISFENLKNSFEKEESWEVGLIFSNQKSALQPNNTQSEDCFLYLCPNSNSVELNKLLPKTTYYYASFTKVGKKIKLGEIKEFTTSGYEAVDLGLSVKWAPCNIGADSPEDYGDYYAWGETEVKEKYGWSTYKWSNGSLNSLTKYCTNRSFGTVDNKLALDPEDDVASVKWGDGWRMPTLDEIYELSKNCTWKWTTVNGVKGNRVTGPNGNSIFLPAAGCRDNVGGYNIGSSGHYWSTTLSQYYEDGENCAFCLRVDYNSSWNYDYRAYGLSVRPVKEK